MRRIRQRWPQAAIVVRGDAGFCRNTIMTWCEQRGVDYVLGLARNTRVLGQIRRQLQQAGKACARTGQVARRFRDFRYRTLQSWGRQRRVVGKAEWLPGQRGANPRFVVTSLSREELEGRQLYEELYCARGEMENRIKEQQLDLFTDRTSTATMRANQLRMYFLVFAGTLLLIMRRYGLAGSPLARAQSGTIRSRILKVAVAVRGDGAQGMAAFLLDVPAQGTLREHREAADGSKAKALSGMRVADGRTGARWRAEGRGQAGVRPDCGPGGQQACQEGHSSLDLGLAASWSRFGYPGW